MLPLTQGATPTGGLAGQSGHGAGPGADSAQAGAESHAQGWARLSHLGVKGSSRGVARGGAGGLPVGGGFSGSSNNLDRGQKASVGAGFRLPDLPGGHRAGEMKEGLPKSPQAPLHMTPHSPSSPGLLAASGHRGGFAFCSCLILINADPLWGRQGEGTQRGLGVLDPGHSLTFQPPPRYSLRAGPLPAMAAELPNSTFQGF